ncbi:FAD:protein FMN transferase [Streptomyces albidoflavus]
MNGGGDLWGRGRAGASARWHVGVAHPPHPGRMASVVSARHDLAFATSGSSERGCHILHPDTGVPVITSAAVTVVGPGLAMTDAFATAALARGADALGWLGALPGYEALAVCPDGRERRMSGFRRYEASAQVSSDTPDRCPWPRLPRHDRGSTTSDVRGRAGRAGALGAARDLLVKRPTGCPWWTVRPRPAPPDCRPLAGAPGWGCEHCRLWTTVPERR